MSTAPDSFRAIIGLWGSPDKMASALGASATAARKWSQRDRIPEEWWGSLLAAPEARAGGVTADLLVALAARKNAASRSDEVVS